MARMTGFVFQDKYLVRLEKLSDQEVGRLVRALATYHATGETQELKGRECGYYDFIKADIDEIEQKYAIKCNNMKRSNNEQTISIDTKQTQLHPIAPNCAQLPINININKKEKDIDNNTTAHAREESIAGAVDLDPLILKVQQELNGLTDSHYNALNDYREELGDELVSFAIDSAVGNGVRNWSYVEAILRDYEQKRIKTIGEAKADHEKRKQQKSTGQQRPRLVRAQDYAQRDYSETDTENDLGVRDLFG